MTALHPALHPFTKLSNRLLRPPWRIPLHSGQEQGWRPLPSPPASRATHQAPHTHHGESGDLLMAQVRHGAPWLHCRPSSHPPLRPSGHPYPSQGQLFSWSLLPTSQGPHSQGCGAKSSTTPLLFFAVLVSIVVGGDWVSHSSPRSEMLGLSVCLSSKSLSEGRKGMKGRAEPEPREKFCPRFLGEDVQWHSQGKGSSLPHLLGSNLDCLHRGPGWASRTPH